MNRDERLESIERALDEQRGNIIRLVNDNRYIYTQALVAAFSAIAEQLDLDRAITALQKQHGLYAASSRPGSDQVAECLFQIGRTLTQIDALREKRSKPSH